MQLGDAGKTSALGPKGGQGAALLAVAAVSAPWFMGPAADSKRSW